MMAVLMKAFPSAKNKKKGLMREFCNDAMKHLKRVDYFILSKENILNNFTRWCRKRRNDEEMMRRMNQRKVKVKKFKTRKGERRDHYRSYPNTVGLEGVRKWFQ